MITLNILKLLENNGFGTLMLTGTETGQNKLWHEKLPVKEFGVYIMSRGDPIVRGGLITQSFDLYARERNDLDGANRLEAILDFFGKECYPVCALPAVPKPDESGEFYSPAYKTSTIVPTFNINNVGVDSTDRVIYLASAQVTYKKEN